MDDGFELFWAHYPRHRGKRDAWKAWQQLRPDPELQLCILAALEWQSRSWDWVKENGQFVPYAATWLRGARWEDERERRSEPGAPSDRRPCPHDPPCGAVPEWPEATEFRCDQRTLLEMARQGKLELL